MKKLLAALLVVSTVCVFAQQTARTQDIDKFCSDFTAEWIRANPNQATTTRYFTSSEQDRFERQITPETNAVRLDRIKLANDPCLSCRSDT